VPVQSRKLDQIRSLEDHLELAAGLPAAEAQQLAELAKQLEHCEIMPIVGAGGSYDCGMRLARELAKDLHREYLGDSAFDPRPSNAGDFGEDLGAVADAICLKRSQRDAVEMLGLGDESLWPPMGHLDPHFCAYRVLARLAREDLFSEAITFNYDSGFEAGLRDEGFMFSPHTLRGRRWQDHATVISDAATNSELDRRGAMALFKVHGSAERYREGVGCKPEEAIVLRWTQLLDWRRDFWARDVLRERARRHVLLLLGFSGQDPVVHVALTRILEEVYFRNMTGEPRIIVVGHEPDTLTLGLLVKAGLGGAKKAPGTVTHVSTQAATSTAVSLVLLTELLARRLRALPTFPTPSALADRLSAFIVAAPASLRWSFLLRKPAPWQEYAQRINLAQAAKRGYVPLMADPLATGRSLRARVKLRRSLRLSDWESPREASDNVGFITRSGFAYLPVGLDHDELLESGLSGRLQQARQTLDYPRGLEAVLVSDGPGGLRGISLSKGDQVRVP